MEIQKNPSDLSSCYEFWALGDIHIRTVAEGLGPQLFMGTYCNLPATLPTILSLVSQTSVFPSTLAPLHFSMEWSVWDHVIHLHRSLQVPSSLGDTMLHKVPHDLPSVFMTSVKLLSFFLITQYTLALFLLLSQDKLVSTSGSLPVAIYLQCSSLPQRDLISNNHVP